MTTISNAATDTGRVRDHNEDTFADTLIQTSSGAYRLLLVADGMGGHARGEVASSLARDAVHEYLEYGAWHDPAEALRTAFRLANDRVHQAGGDMGTTLVAALVEESTGQYWLHNVGDSRAYLLDGGALTPLTKDHSEVALRVEAGQLTREEASHTKGRNVLLRAIGPEADVQSDGFGPFALRPGQRLLLCSDGLHGMVSDEKLAQMAWAAPLASAPKELIEVANAAGGRDNITVVVAALAGDEATIVEGGRPPAPPARKVPMATVGAVVAFLGIVGVAAGIVIAVQSGGDDGNQVLAVVGGSTPTATSAATTPATSTATPIPPTATPVPPTATPIPPPATPVPLTATPVPPTATPVPPTATPVPPTSTRNPPTNTPAPGVSTLTVTLTASDVSWSGPDAFSATLDASRLEPGYQTDPVALPSGHFYSLLKKSDKNCLTVTVNITDKAQNGDLVATGTSPCLTSSSPSGQTSDAAATRSFVRSCLTRFRPMVQR